MSKQPWRRPHDTRTTTQRGYGAAHQRARTEAARHHEPTHPCVRCGQPLGPMGPQLHYDHNATRTGYLGFSHAGCNMAAGIRASNTRRKGQAPRAVQRRALLAVGGGSLSAAPPP